jgi:hypothetical protein
MLNVAITKVDLKQVCSRTAISGRGKTTRKAPADRIIPLNVVTDTSQSAEETFRPPHLRLSPLSNIDFTSKCLRCIRGCGCLYTLAVCQIDNWRLVQVEGGQQYAEADNLLSSAEIEEGILGLLADIVGAVGSHQPFMEVETSLNSPCPQSVWDSSDLVVLQMMLHCSPVSGKGSQVYRLGLQVSKQRLARKSIRRIVGDGHS